MEKLPRQVYTTEFRQQAVEMITRDGLGIAEASRRLSISPKTLTNWVKRVQGGDSPGGATPRREVTEAEAELSRVRRELGLRCIQRKRRFRVATTDSAHQLPVAPNLLGQRFTATRPDEVWTADITYVATDEGRLYVAAIKDLFAGEIVGRSCGERMTTDLVVRAFEQAVSARRPAAGLTHHSDRGSQYCSREYQALLASYEMRCSMSRKGNCYDNAPVESFFGTLKTELVHHRRYATRAEAARDIREYIDLFYNRQQRQAQLDYLSPAAYTQLFTRQQRAA